MSRNFNLFALVSLVAFFLNGCFSPDLDERAAWALADADLALDLAEVPQDLFFFAEQAEEAEGFAPAEGESQAEAGARASALLFQPWLAPGKARPLAEILGELARFAPEKGFMENLRPFPAERWAEIADNCAWAGYPSRDLPAVTVRSCALRLLPTRQPYFFNPGQPGEGYPFDYLQNSSLPLGTPLRLTYLSADQAWALVETPSAGGWVETDDLALVDIRFILDWLSLPMAALVQEKTALRPFLSQPEKSRQTLPDPPRFASIGTVLPLADRSRAWSNLPPDRLVLYFPDRGQDGYARMRPAVLAAAEAAPWPLPLTRRNLAELGMRMLGQPYGWGGYGGNRDCSATLRDLFLPFGLWLPRNSRAQAGLGQGLDLLHLPPDEKEALILRHGRPFLSLIGMPGHIALYLGAYQGRPVIFHNIWGLRVARPHGILPGRAVIGKTVITTLTPGRERPDLERSLLESVRSLNWLLGDQGIPPTPARRVADPVHADLPQVP